MKKDFFVFRHGETDLNKALKAQGCGMDVDLNTTGIEQAALLIDKLQDKGLEVIFSSPLKRARHTAEIVAQALNLKVFVENDLRECFYGDAEGHLFADYAAEWDAWKQPHNWEVALPNGERKIDALNRVMQVLDKLCLKPYQTMGVAIHKGTMSNILAKFGYATWEIPNCGVMHLVNENGVWLVDGNIF